MRRRAWAGSDDDVFELLTTTNRVAAFCGVGRQMIGAYVMAKGRGEDPIPAVFYAHFGDLAFVPGSSAHSCTVAMCRRFDEAVAMLRSRGENVLGGGE